MTTVAELNAQGIALTREVTTDTLVASFEDTDRLLDKGGLTSEQADQLYTARGWIIAVLEERGQTELIGLPS